MNAAMKMLQRDELMSLEQYARERPAFRTRVLAHKRNRQLQLGGHATLYFEDRLTIQYQIQEMLRIERIFEDAGIQEELTAYNPLIPDGKNWKATFMIEYADPAERAHALATLIGIETSVWMQVEGFPRLHPYADEDLDRTTEEKTAAVHFVRFELTPAMIAAVKAGAAISAGVDHANYQVVVSPVPDATRRSLAADLD
jgi:hypothetical protein